MQMLANPQGDKPELTIQRVHFGSGGDTLIGDLYIPAGVTAANPAPAVTVTGAWMTVKEQMPRVYAREMAARGFIALAFDFRGWGESEGARRQYESPSAKIEDIHAAIACLRSRPEVLPDSVGALAICASAGYVTHAAATSKAIRSVAVVAPWFHDRDIVEQIYGGADAVQRLLGIGRAAEDARASTSTPQVVPAASLTDQRAVMYNAPYYTEPDRGMIPSWRNEADLGFWEGWLTFDSISSARLLKQPFLMVESEAAALPQGAHRFFELVTAPKREVWLEGVSQFDFYDQPEPVRRSADLVAEHFQATLLDREPAVAAR